MDETLLHAQQVLEGCSPRPNSCVLQFESKGELLEFDYVPRPGIYAFLDQLLDQGYELALFAAGVQPYADAALDSFDPTGRYFGQDRFYRQHMVADKKDLRAVFGDRLSGGVVLIDDNAHEVLPDDQLDYGVLVDHWQGDEATTAQALASLESAAKALTDKLSGGHRGHVHADVGGVDVEDDYDQLARAAAAAAMADTEREDREAKAAMAETRRRRAASMRAWLAAVASKRCQWQIKRKQKQAAVDVVVEQQQQQQGEEEGHSVEVEEEEEEVTDQTRRIFNFFIGLLLIIDMLGTWLLWIDQAQEGCIERAKPGQVQLITPNLEPAHGEHAVEDFAPAHDQHAEVDFALAHSEHGTVDLVPAHVEQAMVDLVLACVEHTVQDLEPAHVEHTTEDLEPAHIEHVAEDLKVEPCLRSRPSRVQQRPARATFKGRVFSSASSMWCTIGLPTERIDKKTRRI